MRKMKFNKKFKPTPVDDNDELYPNGIFVFNITKMIEFIKANPERFSSELVGVKETRKFPSNSLNEETIKTQILLSPLF
jgi:hypothetical protein